MAAESTPRPPFVICVTGQLASVAEGCNHGHHQVEISLNTPADAAAEESTLSNEGHSFGVLPVLSGRPRCTGPARRPFTFYQSAVRHRLTRVKELVDISRCVGAGNTCDGSAV